MKQLFTKTSSFAAEILEHLSSSRRFLAAIVLSVTGHGLLSAQESQTLQWVPSPDPNVAGYKVYLGTEPGNYGTSIDVGKTTSTTLENLSDNQLYYCAISAYNIFGIEGPRSSEITFSSFLISLQAEDATKYGDIATAAEFDPATFLPNVWFADTLDTTGPGYFEQSFDVPSSGAYTVWLRVKTEDTDNDQLTFRTNGDSPRQLRSICANRAS